MEKAHFLSGVASIVAPIVEEEGLDVLDIVWTVEHGRRILRILIDSGSGKVGVDDCARISRAIEDVIEIRGVIPQSYDLEVSSPGLNRPLIARKHFEMAAGQTIRVKTDVPIGGRSNYKGVLKRIEGDVFFIEIDKKEYAIPFDRVAKANLEFTV